MRLPEARAVLNPQEGHKMLIEDLLNPQDIKLTSTIKVEAASDRKASVTVPSELRLTPELMTLIEQALQAQGLSLFHMNITSKHVAELKDLPNVVLGEKRDEV
jgi:hypothetical protein